MSAFEANPRVHRMLGGPLAHTLVRLSLLWGLGAFAFPKGTHAQPSANDFLPLTAAVTVLDEYAGPMPEMEVRAVNHEYGLRATGQTDGSGQVTLNLMPGTWSFYATPTHGGMWSRPNRGYLLVALGEVFDTSSRSITLAPDTTVMVNLTSSVFDFGARENYVGFVVQPYGVFLEARSVGVTSGGTQLTLHTRTGLTARPFVSSPRFPGEVLYFVAEPGALTSPFMIEVTAANSALLAIDARDGTGDPTDYHIQLYSHELSLAWSPSIADLGADCPGVRVAPKDYYTLRAVDAFDAQSTRHRVVLHPIVIRPEAGQTLSLSMGGSLRMAAVRTTPRAAAGFAPACQIWLHLQDAYENNVTEVWKWDAGQLKPTIVVHHGSVTSSPFEVYGSFTSKLLEEFDRAQNPTYDITWDFGPWGSGAGTGDLYGQEERRMAIDETASLLSQAPRMARDYRLAMVSDYQGVADAMQAVIGPPVDYKMGVISNIAHAGFEDEVQHGYKVEIGIENARPAGWPQGDTFLDHEAGHGRIHKPPCRFYAISYYGESYATLVAAKSRSELFGREDYMKFLLGGHDLFLRHQHGTPVQYASDYIETMQFVTHYINTHYGWNPHRRMILEWENAFQDIRSALGAQGYSSIEQFAIVYSWLCGENLGLLFEEAAFSVTQNRVATGLGVLQSYLDGLGGAALGIGENVVDAPRTSIPIELSSCPTCGVSDIQATVTYDPSKAVVEAVYKRDLTDSPGWSLSADTSAAGVAEIHLSGTTPVAGRGSVAQINLRLLPDASGVLDFSVGGARTDGVPRSASNGSLTIPDLPLIGPFPILPVCCEGESYSTTLWAVGGTPPYSWDVVEDVLPPGLILDSATGEIRGECSTEGEYLFRARVTDDGAEVSHRWFTISTCNTSDIDGVPYQCEIDTDDDGVPDECDSCPGFDDSADADGDDVPDGCDPCPDNPDPACGPAPIPAVTEWGMVTMVLLVLTAGTLVLLRRRPARA